jgi:hypothetical protein
MPPSAPPRRPEEEDDDGEAAAEEDCLRPHENIWMHTRGRGRGHLGAQLHWRSSPEFEPRFRGRGRARGIAEGARRLLAGMGGGVVVDIQHEREHSQCHVGLIHLLPHTQ